MRPSVVAGLLLLILGCSEESADLALRLDLPLQGTERAAIIAVEAPDRTPLIRALSIQAGAPVAVARAFTPQVEVSVTALLYEETLALLGLVEGDLERSPPMGTPTKPLPEADRILAARVMGGVSDGFSAKREVDGVLEEVRLPAESGPECANFEIRAIPLGDTTAVHFILGIGRGALIGNAAREVAYVTLDGGKAPLAGPDVELFDAFRSENGELWFAAAGGEVHRGELLPQGCTEDPATPCSMLSTQRVRRSGHGEDLLWISGPTTGEVTELFTLSREGHVEHQRLDGMNPVPEERRINTGAIRRRGGIARVAPGEAVVAFYNNANVFRWKDGAVTAEMLEMMINDAGGLSAAAFVPGFGALVGSWAGQIYRYSPGDNRPWKPVSSRIITDNIYAITPFEGTFLFLDDAGRITQFLAGETETFCDPFFFQQGAQDAPVDLSTVGRDVVAAGEPGEGAQQGYVRWLVRRN